ncbi:hypothetical protein [Proteiniborus ethanoligenes]|nr:hypothetical protein [Proteiniborus ethanoligenes]
MRSIFRITVRTKWQSSPIFGDDIEMRLKGNRWTGDGQFSSGKSC